MVNPKALNQNVQRKKKVTATKHGAPKEIVNEKTKTLRVAAYCRVSTLAEIQELSFETQCSYYRNYINTNPNMVLVDVYGDHGLSGLRLSSRPEFQRMLQDCRDGKIDAIYTKSISRFSRNTIDFQKVLDELHGLGIYVYFEEEKIKSDDPQVELILKFLSNIAQERSNIQSQLIKLSVDRNAKQGIPAYKCCYGYRKAYEIADRRLPRNERHLWVIHEEEANTVKMMFEMILAGYNTTKTAKALTALEQEKGSSMVWLPCKICWMLRNIAYKGDIQTHKTVVLDYLNGKAVPNDGYREGYYIKGHHEGIITEDHFESVQYIMAERGRIWKEKRAS